MRLGIGFDESYKPIASVMHYSTSTFLAPVFAMSMIMFENDDRVFNIACMKVAVVAVVSANRAYPLLVGQ